MSKRRSGFAARWGRLDARMRIALGAAALLVVTAVGLVALAGGTAGLPGGGIEFARRAESTDTLNEPLAGPSETPTPTPTEDPTIRSLEDLESQFGEPPDANFARVRIPKLGVDAGVAPRYVEEIMPLPNGPGDVAWYDMSEHPGMGGEPGAGGNAIFAGHVDYNNTVAYAGGEFYRGPGVFNALRLLVPGDTIEVHYNGQTFTYAVAWIEEMPVNPTQTNWGQVWSNAVPVDSITLITCGGEFDAASRSYESRLVVRAERV